MTTETLTDAALPSIGRHVHLSRTDLSWSYLPLAVGIILSCGVALSLVIRIGLTPVLITGLLLIAGAILAAIMISLRDSRENSKAARTQVAAVAAGTG